MTDTIKKCTFCKQDIEKDYFQCNLSYSYDVRGSHFANSKQWLKDCHKSCWNQHWKEMSKFFDDVDEVMNRNKYFVREKGMMGKYVDGDKEYGPVSALWKRSNIEGYHLFNVIGDYPEGITKHSLGDFQKWLNDNNLTYKYESR